MVRILTLLLLTGMLSGCAGGLEAGASGAGSDSPARNGFKFDNVLMEQNKLLAYHAFEKYIACLLYTSPSPRDQRGSRMPSSA